jgi:hypothetical protein
MGGPWLYAISEKSGRVFQLKDGTEEPVSLSSYTRLLQNGTLAQDDIWYIKQNGKNIDTGDELFIYTGDEAAGIIGYATVKEVKQPPPEWRLQIKFNLTKSRLLLRMKPIPASKVREWIHFPRKNVSSLEDYKTALYRLIPWKKGYR